MTLPTEAMKHYCPVCGSFMGLTHSAGEFAFCSWGDDVESPCARYGFGMHRRFLRNRKPTARKPVIGQRGRRWGPMLDDDSTP